MVMSSFLRLAAGISVASAFAFSSIAQASIVHYVSGPGATQDDEQFFGANSPADKRKVLRGLQVAFKAW